MKPFLTHANPSLMETMPSFFMPIAKIFTTERQMALVSFFRYLIFSYFIDVLFTRKSIKDHYFIYDIFLIYFLLLFRLLNYNLFSTQELKVTILQLIQE